MYNLNDIEKNEKNAFLSIINNRGLVLRIIDSKLHVFNIDQECVFVKDVCDLSINDVSDILSISIVESKYVYYLIDIAYDNDCKKLCKKKSL